MNNNSFYSKIWHLLLPIVIQNLLSAAVSSADVIMLSYVGQSAISAVSLASQYAGILSCLFFGLGTGATMLCAQYYGKGDLKAIHVVEGISMRFSLGLCGSISLAMLLCPKLLMLVFTNDPELINLGASYLRFMSIAYLCWGIAEVYLSVLRSVGRVTICTILNVTALCTNILLNAVLIFGLFGAPKLGIVGVSIATSISRLLEVLGCFLVSFYSKNVKLDFRYLFAKNKILFQDFVKLSLPALANDISWGLAFSMYSVIIGHMGSDAVAANSFVTVVRNFGTVLCFGLASAGTILLGNTLGENKLDQAREDAKKLLRLAFASGVFGGLLILASSPFVLAYAKSSLSPEALQYLKYMLLINTYYITGISVNTTLIGGVFRAGGDSRFGFICDSIDMWCYAVPVGFLAAFVFKAPVLVVYFLICTDEFAKWPWVFKRYKSEKWVNNITHDNAC